MNFRKAYDVVVDSGLTCSDPSLAQQAFKDEVDINALMRRYRVTGQVPVSVRLPQYGDFRGVDSYRDALDLVRDAQDNFAQLPAAIRKRFGNDPEAFADFALDPENRPELVKLGLADALSEPAAPAEPVKPAPAPGPSDDE